MEIRRNIQSDQDYFRNVEVIRVPVTTIKTPLFLPSFAQMLTHILTSHDVQVEIKIGYCLLTFPVGTYKREQLPRTHDEKYLIVLPDDFEILEVKRQNEEYSYLQINTDQLSLIEQQGLKASNT